MSDAESYSVPAIAVMVHKLYAERVKDYLLVPPDEIRWKTTKHYPHQQGLHLEKNTKMTPKKRPVDMDLPAVPEIEAEMTHPNVTLLDTTEKVGVSHDRRGYLLLLLEDVKRPIYTISPMARQNISWATAIKHHCILRVCKDEHEKQLIANEGEKKKGKIASEPSVKIGLGKIQELSKKIWQSLSKKSMPLVKSKTDQGLRVDVYPRIYAKDFCLGLQQACQRDAMPQSSLEITEPFDGPIAMTMSASKCSHRLTIIISGRFENDNSNLIDRCAYNIYWGLMDRESDSEIMSMKLNHLANGEINVISPHPETGGEIKPGIPSTVPLSRAYYKLAQVFDDFLEPDRKTLAAIQKLEASGVDFGSAPGGWTQVLAQRVPGLKTICSVDRGIVADRVAKLPHVEHIHGIIEDSQDKIESFKPFAIVTCDASELWSDVMDWFTKIVVHKASRHDGESSYHDGNSKFTLPCVFVITTKLPFKTLKSVQRHVSLINAKLPEYLSDMAGAMYAHTDGPIQSRSYVAHLMANSDGERTIIAIFEGCNNNSE